MSDDTKSLFSSRTFWFNLLTGAATVLSTVQGVLPPPAMPYVVVASALVNIGLRWITTQPVSIRPR